MPLTGPDNIGALLTQPQVPPPGIAPTDPSQVGLWQRFQQRLGEDPNLRMALLTTGLNLLRSPQRGQSGFDVFANAAQTGVGTLDTLRQRDIQQGRLDKQEGLAERRTKAAETGVQQRTRQLNQQGNQFDIRMKHAEAVLKEQQREFNERKKSGELGGESTGGERLINAGIEALVISQPELYPDSPEGRAKARLRVQGIDQAAKDPLGQARIIAGLISDLHEVNPFLDEDKQLSSEEIQRQAIKTYQVIASDLSQEKETAAAAPDTSLEGQTVSDDSGTYTIVALGDGNYKLKNVNGKLSTNTYTADQLQQFIK